MGVVGKLLGKLNAFDPKRDGFAGAVTDESEQTKLGAFLSVVVLPMCVAAYSALYFVQFYYGFGESAPPLYKVTTAETLQYGNQVKELPWSAPTRTDATSGSRREGRPCARAER